MKAKRTSTHQIHCRWPVQPCPRTVWWIEWSLLSYGMAVVVLSLVLSNHWAWSQGNKFKNWGNSEQNRARLSYPRLRTETRSEFCIFLATTIPMLNHRMDSKIQAPSGKSGKLGKISLLKVDSHEKGRGSGRWHKLGIGLGLWRSMPLSFNFMLVFSLMDFRFRQVKENW